MLTTAQRKQFGARGYLPIGQVATTATVDALRTEAIRLMAAMPEDHVLRSTDGHVRVALHLCHLSDVFREHARNARVVAVVGELFEEPPRALTSLLFNKPARVGEALDLHQDAPYYSYLGDDDLLTCWMAIDAVAIDNGCVEYLPGSHRQRLPHRQTGRQQALDIDPSTVDTNRLAPVPLAPGEAVLHHGLTAHRSAANASAKPRTGIATLYIRERVRVTPSEFPYTPF